VGGREVETRAKIALSLVADLGPFAPAEEDVTPAYKVASSEEGALSHPRERQQFPDFRSRENTQALR